ncbi:MAG: tetratricopeptide repeat protein [Sarcina sp.]
MNFNEYSKEKLAKLLFVEINADGFLKALNADNKKYGIKELYIPIDPKHLNQDVKSGLKLDKLPINYFVEGMFLAMGGDEHLKFNSDYKKILDLISDSEIIVKSLIADNIKNEDLEEALMLLLGLVNYKESSEIYEKTLLVCEALREGNHEYNDLQLTIADKAKELYSNEAFPYLYLALAYKDKEILNKALVNINEYIAKGGEKDANIIALCEEISDANAYEEGKEALMEDPTKALTKLLPLADKFEEDAIIRFYIGTCYRRLGNFEKAIYYLQESQGLDNNIVEVVNELGINYASLADYDNAIACFRKAFEATKDVEICTNLIMCYVHNDDIENAKKHLALAEAIDKDDEIVKEIKKYFKDL